MSDFAEILETVIAYKKGLEKCTQCRVPTNHWTGKCQKCRTRKYDAPNCNVKIKTHTGPAKIAKVYCNAHRYSKGEIKCP